jgi:hypothetical protein
MARVYSGSRLMLDPNFILSARHAADEREAAARDVRKDISRGIGEIGASIGGAVDYALERKARNERREMMENAPDIADPEYKAAVERFVETGDIGGLNAYRTIKEGRERMAREAAARERELSIRKQKAEAMAKKTALEDKKVKEDLIAKAKFDLREAEIDYRDAKTQGDRDKAKVNIDRALKDLENAGGDISKYSFPTEEEETIADETAEVETDGAKKSIKGQINDLTIRYNNGFKTKAERAAFIADIDEMRKTAKGSELDELISLREKAIKYITDEEKAEGKQKAKLDKANIYKEKSQNPAEFFVWFNKLNNKEKEDYQKAFKDIFGGE